MMIPRSKAIVIFLMLMFMNSCATLPSRESLKNNKHIPPTTIQNFYTLSAPILAAHWINGAVIAIDEKKVSYPLFMINGYFSHKVPIAANLPHSITVNINFNRGWGSGSGPYTATIVLSNVILAAGSYKLNARVEGTKVIAWLEIKSSAARASADFSSSYSSMPYY